MADDEAVELLRQVVMDYAPCDNDSCECSSARAVRFLKRLAELTANDPEPIEGTIVRDADGRMWRRVDGPYGGDRMRNWLPLDESGEFDNDDPETWTKVAGNYGPVTIKEGE